MDTVSPQPGPLVLPATSAQPRAAEISDGAHRSHSLSLSFATVIPQALAEELWLAADAVACDLTLPEFSAALARVGMKCNFGQPAAIDPYSAQQAAFMRGLRVGDLTLATACALGREAAWERFLSLYRAPLTQAAVAITRSATLGQELADSLYAELYGLRRTTEETAHHSPLESYSGRGSLLGWLRTTLAQRHVDHHRRTHRETPLGTFDAAAPEPPHATPPPQLAHLKHAVSRTLRALDPESRFLLSAYFLDQRTLLEIARILHVHEATVSRRIKRLAADLRQGLVQNLQSGGLSKRAAEEALGTDPRDLEINLRALLQTSQPTAFLDQEQDQGRQGRLEDPANKGANPTESGQS